jgi:hypothetical protein
LSKEKSECKEERKGMEECVANEWKDERMAK